MSARASSLRSELGLMKLSVAAKVCGLGPVAFWRFRKRHKIPLLSGNQIHLDDLNAAFRRERGIPSPTANSTRQ